jgi:hypothetical protein
MDDFVDFRHGSNGHLLMGNGADRYPRYRDRFDFTVTEVATRTTRSLRAHARAGFETLHVYPDATTSEEWHDIALDPSPVR